MYVYKLILCLGTVSLYMCLSLCPTCVSQKHPTNPFACQICMTVFPPPQRLPSSPINRLSPPFGSMLTVPTTQPPPLSALLGGEQARSRPTAAVPARFPTGEQNARSILTHTGERTARSIQHFTGERTARTGRPPAQAAELTRESFRLYPSATSPLRSHEPHPRAWPRRPTPAPPPAGPRLRPASTPTSRLGPQASRPATCCPAAAHLSHAFATR
jgi:hypothetical protein